MNQFFRAVTDTLKSLFTDAGVLLIVIIAPIIYGFYYPLPYSNEMVRNIPVAIVDNAQDSLSRKVIRRVSAAPAINVQVVTDEQQAKQQLLNNQVLALMVIPNDLHKNVIKNKATNISMLGNGGYILPSKYAQQAMADAVLSVSAEIEIKQLALLQRFGEKQIEAISNPVPLQIKTLHNHNEGYGSYVVPAVAWLILQQTLLIGCAMLVSTWWENGKAYASVPVWLGRITAVSLVHYLICLGYTGTMFDFWGYKTLENPVGNLVLIALFSPCIASLGCLFGLLIKDRERTMQVLVFSSLPMYFVSGYSWPTQLLPEFLQYLRWVLPSTPVIQAGVSFNQLGGTLFDNRYHLLALSIIGLFGFILLFWFGRNKNPELNKG